MRASNEQRTTMLALIEQWEQSGMRQNDFYQQHNIPSHVFYYWHKRYKVQNALPRKAIPSTSGFIELQPANVPSGNMELHLRNGNRIIFHQQVSVDYLKALIN